MCNAIRERRESECETEEREKLTHVLISPSISPISPSQSASNFSMDLLLFDGVRNSLIQLKYGRKSWRNRSDFLPFLLLSVLCPSTLIVSPLLLLIASFAPLGQSVYCLSFLPSSSCFPLLYARRLELFQAFIAHFSLSLFSVGILSDSRRTSLIVS